MTPAATASLGVMTAPKPSAVTAAMASPMTRCALDRAQVLDRRLMDDGRAGTQPLLDLGAPRGEPDVAVGSVDEHDLLHGDVARERGRVLGRLDVRLGASTATWTTTLPMIDPDAASS